MKQRVLIVDDNDDFRKTVKDFLNAQDLNIEVFEAITGEMGVAKSSFVKPDVVLMDISLPKINGLAAAKFVKQDNPQCDIIVLTMFDTKEFKRMSHGIEASAFIGKNDLYEQLVPTLKKCLLKRGNSVAAVKEKV